MVDRAAALSVAEQCEVLSLNRASLYYKGRPPSAQEVAIKHRIDELYTRYPFYGSRRMTAQLVREGQAVNRKRVQHYMREMAISGICPGPNLSKRNQRHLIYPYLLANFDITAPNQVWGVDITYIRLLAGWMYLVAVIDWYSRYVVSWELDVSLEMTFVMTAVDRALRSGTPIIWNSDQGSHFTSPVYTQRLKSANVQISMDGKGRAIDNIFTERLWRSIKYEEVYLNSYETPREARERLRNYLLFYNRERPHQSLGYRTPSEVHFGISESSCPAADATRPGDGTHAKQLGDPRPVSHGRSKQEDGCLGCVLERRICLLSPCPFLS
jgi:putative transposase